jgi:glucosamine 6-phosphate synthetase-like amidotransferase/phosphosugar isomerase protein
MCTPTHQGLSESTKSAKCTMVWGAGISNLNMTNKTYKRRGVSHCGLAIYIKKYLKAKEEELWKLK